MSASWDTRTALEDLLARGVDDWINASEVVSIVARFGLSDPSLVRFASTGLIAEAIVAGFATPGQMNSRGQFEPWDCTPGDAIERIIREWLLNWAQDYPPPGAVVWLSNTESGDSVGRGVLAVE